jgi:type IV pilus modification protein PilV
LIDWKANTMATAPRLQRSRSVHRQAGFALIEALIAFLVVSFGMLGIASFQYTLSRASDVAKQRSEATRIAQKEIDRLRSFAQRAIYDSDLVTANATPVLGLSTNTTYSMERVATTPAGDKFRWINVIVSWVDRSGQNQDVRLATAISDGDPSDLGVLGVTRRPSSTLRPKNRNINVPYPSVNIATCPAGSTACSAFVPPPGNVAYVFDNVSGNVIQSCALTQYTISALARSGTTAIADVAAHPFTAGSFVSVSGASPAGYNGEFRVGSIVGGVSFSYAVPSTLATPATVASATARWALVEGIDLSNLPGGVTCTTYSNDAYLLSGYVRFVTSGTPNADDIINTSGNTFDLLSTGPLTITTSAGQAPTGYTCYAQRQRVVATPNVRGETIAANGYVRAGNVVTITTTRNHSFTAGMVIAVTGTSDYVLQGQFEVIDAPSNRTLTYGEIGPDTTASGGRVELIQQLTVAENESVPAAYNTSTPISTFVAYTCVVTPSTTGTPREWWGRLNLVPETDPAGGTRVTWDTTSYRVCRYTADYNGFGLTNSDHPSYYRQVTGTLDNQNFVVIPAAATCPTDTAPTFTGNQAGNFNNTNTAAHQPTPSDSPGEPASTSDSIDME